MRCEAVLEILLEADLESLRTADHVGADHVARCPECQRAVDRILEGERLLDGWLGAAHEPDAQAIVAGAETRTGPQEEEGAGPEATGADTAGAEGAGGRSDSRGDAARSGSVGRRDLDGGSSSPGRSPRRRAVQAGAGIALAAAAVVTFLLVGDSGSRSESGVPDGVPTAADGRGSRGSPRVALRRERPARLPATPEVEVPAGRNAAILRTNHPEITVIWFYGGD